MKRRFDRALLDDVEIEFVVRGAGEPVMLVQPGIFADWYEPLLDEQILTSRYKLVAYHRVGSAGSSHVAGSVSIAQHASHCRSLMRYLGIKQAHVVGHSSGGMVGFQLALDAPEAVQTLVLQESARPLTGDAPEEIEFIKTVAAPAGQRYAAGDKAGAVDTFLRGVGGQGYRAVLERALPRGAFDQYVTDADSFFAQELPAIREWSFTRADANRVTQPVLAVLGAKSTEVTPVFGLRQKLLLAWLPNVEAFLLPDATHLLHLENPRGMAEGLVSFFGRHAFSTTPPGSF